MAEGAISFRDDPVEGLVVEAVTPDGQLDEKGSVAHRAMKHTLNFVTALIEAGEAQMAPADDTPKLVLPSGRIVGQDSH